ncbi:MAG: DUF5915 domain-containing protein, partial [Rickettsiales bacterium]|nr:DUF5915 domain-containing protein [Rickettsiales bacterium]
LNFPLLGKKVPDKIKKLVQHVKEGKWKQIENEQIFLGDNSENYIIEKGEYELLLKANSKYSSAFDNNKGVVILNTELNDELILEGLARDVVRLIQETRKQADFHISNRIRVVIKTEGEKIKEAVGTWSEYIKEQTLALSLEINVEIGTHFYSKEYQDLIVGIKLDF